MLRGCQPNIVLSATWLCFVLLLAAATLPAQETSPASTDKELLQGSWKIAAVEKDGEKRGPDETEQGTSLVIKDAQLDFGKIKFNYAIDATTDPKLFDVTLISEDQKGPTFEGIYRLEKDKFTLCVYLDVGTKSRPQMFQTQAGSKSVLIEFARSE